MKSLQIYLIQNGQQAGPFSVEVIRGMLSTGHIAVTDQGWHEGLTAWQPLSTFLPIPEPPPVAPPPVSPPPPPVADTAATNAQSFGSWYDAKFGKTSGIKQALAWVFYGFIWIPVWWLISTQSQASASENSGESGGQSFSSWYRAKMGIHSRVKQVFAWAAYGIIWIPCWWAFSKGSPPKARWVAAGLLVLMLIGSAREKKEQDTRHVILMPVYVFRYIF